MRREGSQLLSYPREKIKTCRKAGKASLGINAHLTHVDEHSNICRMAHSTPVQAMLHGGGDWRIRIVQPKQWPFK